MSSSNDKLKQIAWLIDPNNGMGFYGTPLAYAIQKILEEADGSPNEAGKGTVRSA